MYGNGQNHTNKKSNVRIPWTDEIESFKYIVMSSLTHEVSDICSSLPSTNERYEITLPQKFAKMTNKKSNVRIPLMKKYNVRKLANMTQTKLPMSEYLGLTRSKDGRDAMPQLLGSDVDKWDSNNHTNNYSTQGGPRNHTTNKQGPNVGTTNRQIYDDREQEPA